MKGRRVRAIRHLPSFYPVATTFPSYNPLDSIEMFMRRARSGEADAPSLRQDEDRLSLEDAIKAATISNAWLMNKENEIGSIEVGKSADFVILENNLFEISVHEISQTEVLGTYYKGRQTYSGNP
ncbi:MAG: amidohydrolase family protein [Thermoanaerobaculia bacterium]